MERCTFQSTAATPSKLTQAPSWGHLPRLLLVIIVLVAAALRLLLPRPAPEGRHTNAPALTTHHQGAEAAAQARIFRERCKAPAKATPLPVDVVLSELHGFVYVDNVKAASSSTRDWLSANLNASWSPRSQRCKEKAGPPLVRRLRHHFWSISRAFRCSPTPNAVRVPWSPYCPC